MSLLHAIANRLTDQEEGEKKDADGESDKKKKKKDKKEKKEKKEKPCHRRTQSCVQTFTVGLNVLDRDEKHINDTVNVSDSLPTFCAASFRHASPISHTTFHLLT